MLLWKCALLKQTTNRLLIGFKDAPVLYRFNDSTAHTGTWPNQLAIRGTLTFSEDNPFGSGSEKSLEFNGSSGLYWSSGPINGTGDFSVGCWVRPTNDDAIETIIQQRDQDNDGQFTLFCTNAAEIGFQLSGFGAWVGTTCRAPRPVQTGTWFHVVVTRVGQTVNMYLNGTLAASTTKSTIPSVNSSNGLSIGFDQRDNNWFFLGNLKDVFILHKALTAEEIEYIATSNSPYPNS